MERERHRSVDRDTVARSSTPPHTPPTSSWRIQTKLGKQLEDLNI